MLAHVSCLKQGKRPVLQCSMQLATSEKKERCLCARYCEICDVAFPHVALLLPRRTPSRSRLAGCHDATSNVCNSLELCAQCGMHSDTQRRDPCRGNRVVLPGWLSAPHEQGAASRVVDLVPNAAN